MASLATGPSYSSINFDADEDDDVINESPAFDPLNYQNGQ
jgi:hypothetical protein